MIYLYGKLREEFGATINCSVRSVKELMKAAEVNRPGFKDKIDKNRGYVIRRGADFKDAKAVGPEEVEMRFGEDDWHVLPAPMGSGKVVKVILGVVLIIVGYWTSWAGGAALAKVGVGLIVSGVAEMLSPTASSSYSMRETAAERPSYIFDGPTNRSAAGGAKPMVFGRNVYTGSVFVSGGLEISDIA